jgi:hypothetical protein
MNPSTDIVTCQITRLIPQEYACRRSERSGAVGTLGGMSTIEVEPADGTNTRFTVRVTDEDGSETTHEVTLRDDDWDRFGPGHATRVHLVEASFRFLLEREPKNSILRTFDLNVIARYFPEYAKEIAERASS